MDGVFNDKRFNHAISDRRFKNVPRKDKKVKIDKRFQSMFTDKRFQIKYSVDERGRRIDALQSENYKKYYDLSDSSEESGSESTIDESSIETKGVGNSTTGTEFGIKEGQVSVDSVKEGSSDEEFSSDNEIKTCEREKLKEAQKEVNKYIDEIHKKKLDSNVRDKLSDFRVDYARGIGVLLSESSSDESSSDESEIVNIEHPWGELDKDAEETNEITSRLAVCNMDWDRVTASDLMVLFHSFLPPDGVIESVTIYPSEFGLARLAEEEQKGPIELVEAEENDLSSNLKEFNEAEEGSTFQMEKLREYQLKRLKYYYAVVVCNSKETANVLYTECDGIEYESSAMKLDLRFVGDDVAFEQTPHDKCTNLPDLKKYKPRLFVNTALQQGKVELTWDETDPNRIDFNRRLLAGEEVDENDIQTYVANSSSSEQEESSEKGTDTEEGPVKGDRDHISKYRELVANLQDGKSKKGDMEMEVTWGVDSRNKDRAQMETLESEEEEESSVCSIGIEEDKSQKLLRNKKKTKKSKFAGVICEDKEQNDELELLLADDNPAETGLRHFSLKEIQKKEKQELKKKKWQKRKKRIFEEEDSFKINTADERFSAVYSSHQFNIDPADPHFRKTKGMEQLIAEKQKRQKIE